MGVKDHDARLRFLESASEELRKAPAVSSWLQHTKTVAAAKAGTPTTTGDTCTGCSRLLLPGFSCDVLRAPRKRKDRLSGKPVERRGRCHACGTVNELPAKALRRRKRPGQSDAVQSSKSLPNMKRSQSLPSKTPSQLPKPGPVPPQQASTSTQPPNPTKKRARGKNASLQALLANKKPDAPKKPGFDFMDFLAK